VAPSQQGHLVLNSWGAWLSLMGEAERKTLTGTSSDLILYPGGVSFSFYIR
jgi:hypothetical protein